MVRYIWIIFFIVNNLFSQEVSKNDNLLYYLDKTEGFNVTIKNRTIPFYVKDTIRINEHQDKLTGDIDKVGGNKSTVLKMVNLIYNNRISSTKKSNNSNNQSDLPDRFLDSETYVFFESRLLIVPKIKSYLVRIVNTPSNGNSSTSIYLLNVSNQKLVSLVRVAHLFRSDDILISEYSVRSSKNYFTYRTATKYAGQELTDGSYHYIDFCFQESGFLSLL